MTGWHNGRTLMQPGQGPETHYANNGGVHIAYQVLGDGPIDLVFVMGWVTHMDYFWLEPGFARFLRRLASFSRLILVDKRGTGLSDRAVGLPTLEERIDDIRAVMDAVGSRRAALMGISEGGPMCILLAATYPERTAALVLMATAPRFAWAPDWAWGFSVRVLEQRAAELEQGWGTLEWGARDLQRRAPSMANDESFTRWFVTYLRMGGSPGAAMAMNRMNMMIDTRHVLPAIRVPTLIVHRAGDLISRVESARYMAAHIPGARYVELPGNDHLPFVGNLDEMLTPVEELLGARHPAAGPDRVLATVLALEVADWAQVMAAVGQQRWHDLQESYADVVRRALDLYRGRAVTTASEGFLATFDGPSRAIRCAQTIVEESTALGILPRAGLHTGECDLVDGEPSGLALRVAAWAMAHADPGEILSSNTVRDLVSGSGITFGEANLRAGAPGPGGTWRLFRIDSRRQTSGGGAKHAQTRLPSQVNVALTPREREVVALLARGRTNREIADALIISERTVENHVSNVLGKLGLETRAQVAIWALRGDEAPTSVSA